MTRRRNQTRPGRHCIICNKPGGMGATMAVRALVNLYKEKGLKPPYDDSALHDVKAHGPCIIAARKNLATF